MKNLAIIILLILLAACAREPASPTPASISPTPTRAPGAVALLATPKPLPTAANLEHTLNYQGLLLGILSAEQNESYTTEYGTTREAPAGSSFLWVQLSLDSADNNGIPVPDEDHFSVLYGGEEFKPTYGHREGCPDYTSLSGTLSPGNSRQAWLRFDLPAEAELDDLQFAFLPDSTKAVSALTENEASYYDHPLFLWRLSGK